VRYRPWVEIKGFHHLCVSGLSLVTAIEKKFNKIIGLRIG
jgi:hypothetical protein